MSYEQARAEADKKNAAEQLPAGVFYAATHKPGSDDWTIKLCDVRQ